MILAMIMLEKLMRDLGFTNNEIKVYESLLKIGSATTGKIIEESQISSGKIYETLNKLIDKGIVNFIKKNNIKVYTASSPSSLFFFLEQKKKKIIEEEKKLAELLPKLEKMPLIEKESISVYKGYKGIRNIGNDLLEHYKEKELQVMGVTGYKSETFNLLWENWHKNRVNKRIACRILFTDKNTPFYNFFKKLKLTKVRYILGKSPSAFLLMGDSCLIISYGEYPLCLLIKHEAMTKTLKYFFDNLWNIAEK